MSYSFTKLYNYLKNNLEINNDDIIEKIIPNLIVNGYNIESLKVLLENFDVKDLMTIKNINSSYLAILKSHHINYEKKLYELNKQKIVKKINDLNNVLNKIFFSYDIIPTIKEIDEYDTIILNIGDEITKSRKSFYINDYDQLDTLYDQLLNKRKLFNKCRLNVLNKEINNQKSHELYNSMEKFNREILENFVPDTNSFKKEQISEYRNKLYDFVTQYSRLKNYITNENCEKLNFQFARSLDNDKLMSIKEQEYIRKSQYQSASYM
jgi:hypothetical protein